MRIFTGYYAKQKYYENNGCICISIAGRCPNWYHGLEYKKLAPKYGFFMKWKNGQLNNDEYVDHFYSEVLDKLDALEVWNEIKTVSNKAKIVILLCYEKPGDFCHRHIVADWFNTELENIPEVIEYE